MPRTTRCSCPRTLAIQYPVPSLSPPSRSGLVPRDQLGYCFVTSLRATVFSSPLDNLTVTLPSFSSTLTTVASLDDPLDFTFTLSPALNCDVPGVLVAGVACSFAPVFGLAVAPGLVFRLALVLSGVELESQAAKASAKTTTAK